MKKKKKYNLFKNQIKSLLFSTNELSNINNNKDLINMLGDYITDDIANDWVDNPTLGMAKNLFANKNISEKEVMIIEKIIQNFEEVSCGEKKYEKIIWTLEGLYNHPFWKKQRELAKELIVLLEKDLLEIEKQEN